MKKLMAFLVSSMLVLSSSSVWAVSLFGQVENSDSSTPADADLTFVSLIEGTDNEIRTEDSTGAIYSTGFYQDETSNFNGVNTGDQYDIFFTNLANGEAGSISTNVPSSDSQFDVSLAVSSNPAIPTGLSASVPSQGTVSLNWNDVAGLTYHIYRRINGVTSRYTRIDDVTGQNSGVADPPYIDSSTDGASIYYYIILAEDGSGRLSGHTDEVMGDSTLPVVLSSFSAKVEDEKVTLNWSTATETNNLGFNVQRGESENGPFTKVNPSLIAGAGTDANPHDYQFVDETVREGARYYYSIEDVDFAGNTERSRIIEVVVSKEGISYLMSPERTLLFQCYPNPFNPETWIPYQLANDAQVSIRIFDITGKLVKSLDLGNQRAGFYLERNQAAYWDGRNQQGERVSSGPYFYQFTTPDFQQIKRMVILK